MPKRSDDEDDESTQEVLGDSQFEMDPGDEFRPKKGKPFVFLGISVAAALVLALFVLYFTDSGPFSPPPVAETIAPVAQPTSLPASEPVALPLPTPADPPKTTLETREKTPGKKGKVAKKKATKTKKKKKR